MQGLLLNFPEGFTPRDKQAIALKQIEKAIQDGHKFIVLHGDTGVGKSHISKTLGNASKEIPDKFKQQVRDYSIFSEDGAGMMDEYDPFGCFALTITKSLQDQYQSTFDDTGVLKGQGNYQCDVDDSLTVDVAPCLYAKGLKNECWKACRCPYYNARNEMLTSRFSALNYSMFFSLPEHLRSREIMICDEGSELEEQLVSQFTCEVDIPFLVKTQTPVSPFPSDESPTKVREWVGKLSRSVLESCEEYKEWFKDPNNKKDHITFSKKKTEYTKLSNLGMKLGTLSATYFESQYIIEHVNKMIRFIPLKVDVLSKYLFDYADIVVILSATIIDPPKFCASLGIKEYEYIHIDTDFDAKKSPLHIMVNQKLNYSNLKQNLPKLMDQISGILDHHKNDKGIIHTHTQYIADYVRERVGGPRLLCREQGVRNEELLELHESMDEPTVLVSPSMTYGVDLKGDLGKFQIILKAPWLPTKDVRVEKLMKIDKSWYGNMMLKTLVQACGRAVRTEDDECETYILDGSIFDAITRNKSKLPKFFLDRLQ